MNVDMSIYKNLSESDQKLVKTNLEYTEESLKKKYSKTIMIDLIALLFSIVIFGYSAYSNLGWFFLGALGAWCSASMLAFDAETNELLSENPILCKKALSLVESHALVKNYRDAVVSNGRQLRAFDLGVMIQLGEEGAREEERATCKKLHGIIV